MSLLARRVMPGAANPGSPGSGETADTSIYTEPFLDEMRLAALSGVSISVNTPTKDASNPLFPTSADTGEWDEDKNYVSVTKDADGWHMHYKGWDGTDYHLGYASSSDGASWTKPNLGIHSYGGDTNNNIILEALFTQAQYDPTSGKWVYTEEDVNVGNNDELFIYTADDPNVAPSLAKTIDTGEGGLVECKGMVRRLDGRWVIYYVKGHTSQARSLYAFVSDSTDLTGDWTRHGLVLESPAGTNQYYAIGPTRIGGVIYALVSRYNSTSEQVWIDAYRSYDGLVWYQADANWIDVGTSGAWDDEMVGFGGRITENSNTWYAYYIGSPEDHAASHPRDSRVGEASIDKQRIGSIGTTGSVTTRVITVAAGATLTVNVDASGGSLDMEVQDSDGNAITNFAEADFDTISTDETGATPTWGGSEMPDDRDLILKFVLSGATLYNFEISDAAPQETPLTIPGLISWLDASQITGVSNGATITEWPDETLQSNEGGNSGSYNEPSYHTGVLNSLPVIRFDDANSEALYWVNPKAGAFTIFAVIKTDDSTADQRIVSSYDGGGSPTASQYILDIQSGGNYRFIRGTDGAMTGGTPDNTWHYLTARTGPSGGIMREDGTQIASDATAYSTRSGQFFIGEDSVEGGAAEYFDGDMAELLFYDRELTDSEVSTIESYLASKYAL